MSDDLSAAIRADMARLFPRKEKKVLMRDFSGFGSRVAGDEPVECPAPRRAKRKKPEVATCQVCGKAFKPRSGLNVNCSVECYRRRQVPLVDKVVRECRVCGVAFEVAPKLKKMCCSAGCSCTWERQKRRKVCE